MGGNGFIAWRNDMSKLKISKQVPATTKTLTARWCKRQFITMSKRYRSIRATTGNPMDCCYWCGHKFPDGEMMALAAFNDIGNKVLCQSCADELIGSATAPGNY